MRIFLFRKGDVLQRDAALHQRAVDAGVLGLAGELAVLFEQQVERATHAERGQGEITHEHAAVGVVVGQGLQRGPVAADGIIPALAELMQAPRLRLDQADTVSRLLLREFPQLPLPTPSAVPAPAPGGRCSKGT